MLCLSLLPCSQLHAWPSKVLLLLPFPAHSAPLSPEFLAPMLAVPMLCAGTVLWLSCLYPGSTEVSSYCPSVENSHVRPSLHFLVPPGYESRLCNVAGAHLRLEARKLGQGKGQPAPVPPSHAFRGSHHRAAPNPPQEQSSLFHSPKKQVQPKRLGPWQVGLSIQSVAHGGRDILERRKDVEQTVVCPRAGAMLWHDSFTAWLVKAICF